ncbi:glycosyltransferase family 2 protein [Rothia sp. P6271]|uniref:glycosyltransferase family 2 protein n=1 Tax=unclassified Rothia (in: high G+C Gram-positive bacteria) TaxID=2689056 RepID=UPI003AD59529
MSFSAPRTSIIMPVYNTAERVISSIQSVLAQSDPDFELLILVDGATDHSAQVIEQFLHHNPDPRLRFFNNAQNQGVSRTRNQGLEHIRGQWVAFLDSDDTYRPHFLESLHSYTERYDADIVTSVLAIAKPDGSVTPRPTQPTETFLGQEAAYHLLQGGRITPYLCDKIIRSSLFENVRFCPDIHRGEDALVTLALCLNAQTVVATPEVQYEYFMESTGLSWGRITPVEESLALMQAQAELLGERLNTVQGRKAYDVSWIITFLNSSQQAIFNDTAQGREILSRNRQLIRWSQIYQIISINPIFCAAATLLKLCPPLYRVVYRAYVKRTYGL